MDQTNTKLKIFIIAGEASGDVLGAGLMASLKDQHHQIDFSGVGGPLMTAQGLSSIFPMSDICVFGVAEVLPKLPKILKRMKQTIEEIKAFKPDLVITIDAPDFNFRIAKRLRMQLPDLNLVHYVAPTVWAMRPWRAKAISKFLDMLLVVLPFEPPYFETHGLRTKFVGHPVFDHPVHHAEKPHTLDLSLVEQKTLVLLPGSRPSEVRSLLPVFAEIVQELKRKSLDLKIYIPVAHMVKDLVADLIEKGVKDKSWPVKPILLLGEDEKYKAFTEADFAIAASGTVSLELAHYGVPHLIAYKVNAFTAWLIRRLVKIKYVNLVNILLGKEIVPEYLQERCDAKLIALEAYGFLTQPEKRRAQQKMLERAGDLLSHKDQESSHKAAEEILKFLHL